MNKNKNKIHSQLKYMSTMYIVYILTTFPTCPPGLSNQKSASIAPHRADRSRLVDLRLIEPAAAPPNVFSFRNCWRESVSQLSTG